MMPDGKGDIRGQSHKSGARDETSLLIAWSENLTHRE